MSNDFVCFAVVWQVTACYWYLTSFSSKWNRKWNYNDKFLYPRSPKGGGGILFYLCLSVLPSKIFFVAFFSVTVGFYTHWSYMHIFRHIFLSNYWWQKSDIWSQASYRYPISWEAFLDPIRFLLPVCRLSWFLYTLNIYAHFLSHFSQQLLMAEIWYLVTSFI